MNIEAISTLGNAAPGKPLASDQVNMQRKEKEKVAETPQAEAVDKKVQPEELLSQIKAVTEDGAYGVRFERDDQAELIVKIFDIESDEVIRQIPADEILQLRQTLEDLRGNIVNTQG